MKKIFFALSLALATISFANAQTPIPDDIKALLQKNTFRIFSAYNLSKVVVSRIKNSIKASLPSYIHLQRNHLSSESRQVLLL